jgi:hypothetical protein
MLITKAPPAAPLTITSTDFHLFMADGVNNPGVCLLDIPGSSGLDLQLLNATATGSIQANQPGTIEIALFAYVSVPHTDPPADDVGNWVMLGKSPAEPVGATTDLPTTSWMIQGRDLMFNLISGKMQGTVQSNVADNPEPAADLSTNPNGIDPNLSPLMYFAVGARFTPDDDDGATPEMTMAHFNLTGEL